MAVRAGTHGAPELSLQSQLMPARGAPRPQRALLPTGKPRSRKKALLVE